MATVAASGNRSNPAGARKSTRPWREHAYGTLACKLVCGPSPVRAGAQEHTCVYLRDPADLEMVLRGCRTTLSRCWCQLRS